jgi:predicted transcriptional regulator
MRVSSSRRKPSQIALKLLDCIDEKGETSRWDLIKILGNNSQFHHWVEDFLIREKFIEERRESRNYYYKKTETGELLHKLLKNGDMMRSLLLLSGKRLKRQKFDVPWE